MLSRVLILSPSFIGGRSTRKRLSLLIHYQVGRSIQIKSWIDSDLIPEKVRPFLHLARADKQVGTSLLYWPCLWSIALAAPVGSLPDIITSVQFAVGAVVMRSAGCIINDMWDRDFDKHVERTKRRPLASGEITMKDAVMFLAAHLTAGLGILLSLNTASIKLGFLVMPMVVGYPLMKRFSNWPQFFLGMTFNWGALMGWTAVTGALSLSHTLPLYISGVCWTLVYDTLYGYQDRKDDSRLGLKSTALTLGDRPQISLSLMTGGMISGLLITGYISELALPYYCLVGAAGSHLMWQIWSADLNSPKNLWLRFDSNKYIGGVIAAAVVAGKVVV